MPTSASPSDLFRPYVWLALITFVIGFAVTLATGAGHVAAVRAQIAREAQPALSPADLQDRPLASVGARRL